MACPKCRSKVNEEDGEWICRRCGAVSQPIPRLLINLLLEDNSGTITATFGGSLAEKLLGMKADYALDVAAQSGGSSASIEMASRRIINRVITLTGSVKKDDLEI